MKFGSLFSGIGGLDLGLERAGMECKWQVENDDYCRRVLRKHWPDVQRYKDARNFPPREGCAEVDLICGGDPCQSHSGAAGPNRSVAPSLGADFLAIVDELRPRIVLRENPTHTRRDASWPWWRFRSALESIGYAVLPFRLRACCLGADHRRDRLFLLAEYANANGHGLERWDGENSQIVKTENISTFLDSADWNDICTCPGHRSRAGLPAYVDRVKGLGNAVVPQVAEWIGRRILQAEP